MFSVKLDYLSWQHQSIWPRLDDKGSQTPSAPRPYDCSYGSPYELPLSSTLIDPMRDEIRMYTHCANQIICPVPNRRKLSVPIPSLELHQHSCALRGCKHYAWMHTMCMWHTCAHEYKQLFADQKMLMAVLTNEIQDFLTWTLTFCELYLIIGIF